MDIIKLENPNLYAGNGNFTAYTAKLAEMYAREHGTTIAVVCHENVDVDGVTHWHADAVGVPAYGYACSMRGDSPGDAIRRCYGYVIELRDTLAESLA